MVKTIKILLTENFFKTLTKFDLFIPLFLIKISSFRIKVKEFKSWVKMFVYFSILGIVSDFHGLQPRWSTSVSENQDYQDDIEIQKVDSTKYRVRIHTSSKFFNLFIIKFNLSIITLNVKTEFLLKYKTNLRIFDMYRKRFR